MKKVALFGGAFNPPTLGHKDIVEGVLKSGVVDEVWITPAFISMTGKSMVDFDERVKMCELTFKDVNNAIVSSFEKEYKNQGSLELLNALFADNTDIEFYFIIGLDNANLVLTEWKRGQELIELVNMIVLDRKGVEANGDMWYYSYPHHYLKNIEAREISSTDIRKAYSDFYRMIEPMKTIDFLRSNVESKTKEYIFDNKYYK